MVNDLSSAILERPSWRRETISRQYALEAKWISTDQHYEKRIPCPEAMASWYWRKRECRALVIYALRNTVTPTSHIRSFAFWNCITTLDSPWASPYSLNRHHSIQIASPSSYSSKTSNKTTVGKRTADFRNPKQNQIYTSFPKPYPTRPAVSSHFCSYPWNQRWIRLMGNQAAIHHSWRPPNWSQCPPYMRTAPSAITLLC